MTTLDTLNQFREQAEAELTQLREDAERQNRENKELRAQIVRLQNTVSSVATAAQRYVDEQRGITHEAVNARTKARAYLVAAQDEMKQVSHQIHLEAERLNVPLVALEEFGFTIQGANPLSEAKTVQKRLREICKRVEAKWLTLNM
jgi:cell division septum initiation protein DivIVA